MPPREREGFVEYTFVGPDDHELYVDRYDAGVILDLYGDREAAAALAGVDWEPGANPLFLHAVDPEAAYRCLAEQGWLCTDLDPYASA